MSKTASRRRAGAIDSHPATAATVEAAHLAEVRRLEDTVELMTVRLAEAATGTVEAGGTWQLEQQVLTDPGWRVFQVLTEQEFSPDGMRQLRAICRLMGLANPLVKRGLSVRAHYVWGQGCQITARANGKSDDNSNEQDVHHTVDEFVQDPANQRAVFGQQAREENERALGTDGEVFVALYTRPRSGWVQARAFAADEISEVICNPDDQAEPWFYRRVREIEGYNEQGMLVRSRAEELHPDVDYKPRNRPARFAGVVVKWDAPVVHVHVNRPKGWLRGIPDAYAVINWARAYKEFLEQWSKLMASLAKFAWRLTSEGRNRAQAKAAVAAAGTSRNPAGERNDVGGTAITPPGATFEAIPKSGATIDAESGRPLAMMVAAGLDIPVTMLLADPGQTGARATAETLDWPTELAMMARREVWTAAQSRIVRYVIAESVRAPQGRLKGTVKRDPVTEREIVTLAGNTDDTVDIDWPSLDEVDPKAVLEAIQLANATGTVPPDLVLRLALQALKIRDIDAILDKMRDDQGNFLWPQSPQNAGMGPGQQAADLARAGRDPAGAGPGSMGPDGEPMPPPADTPLPGPDDQHAATAAIADGITAEAAARQADADFGLGGTGSEGTQDAADTADTAEPDAGDEPDGLYDPEFFKIT